MGINAKQNIYFNRIYLVVFILILFWVVLEIRLFVIQVVNHDFYVEQSRIQSSKKIQLTAQRGDIYDKNGECLATNLIHYDLGVDLTKIKNKRNIIKTFAKTFNRPEKFYENKLNTNRDFIYLTRKTPDENIDDIKSLDDPGLVKLQGFRRYYPFGQYGSQVIGFTDVDDKGVSGLELQYDAILKGQNGWTFLMADAKRNLGYHVDFPKVDPEQGSNIVLTLDKNYQTIIEDELSKGVKESNANYGMAVLLDPNTSEILAMCSYPGFNPNQLANSNIDHRVNRAIVDVFEPGSTFKIFSAAALLQEGIKKPNDIVYCENGSYKFFDHVIHDSEKYGWLSFRNTIENSSNIGMVKLIEELPKNKFYRYLKNFGFDSHTGVNLVGENGGMLSKPSDFSGISKGVISFGQEIGVTALQITNAFACVVNGGYLMRPYLVKKIITDDGTIIEENKPFKIRQVISADVADILKSFMLGVVERGTGKKAAVEGLLVGGKTGTAQKFNKTTKQYKKYGHLASFIGYAPQEKPRYVLGIFLDEPTPNHYGGQVAAPIFSSAMKRIMEFVQEEPAEFYIEPKIAKSNSKIPNLKGISFAAAEELLQLKDIDYDLKGDGSHILKQSQNAGDLFLVLGEPNIKKEQMPNLKGLSIREALNIIDFSDVNVRISGSGKVMNQSIKPGTIIKNRQTLSLTCVNE